MNRLKLLLIGSVALNIALITLLAFTRASSPRSRPESPPPATAPLPPATSTTSTTAPRRDYARLLENLLSRGWTQTGATRLVRDAALSDWIATAQRLQNAQPHWHPPLPPLEQLARQREISQERRARETALATLLGHPPILDPHDPTALHLPPETAPERIHAVSWLEEDYRMLLEETRVRSAQTGLSPDHETVRLLQQERRDDLAAILSPAELAHYELRASPAAQTLRAELRYFQPSESEFRAILQTRQNPETENSAATLRETLGEERFQSYLRATDEHFQQLADLAERFQLPPNNILEVHRFANLLEKQQREILDDTTLTEDEKIIAIDLLISDARDLISETLGPPAFEAYLQTAGWWLHPTPKN